MPKSIVQSTVDRIKKAGSPMPTKPKCRTHKINERSQRLLMRTIGDDPFVTYDRLLELHNVGVEVCRQTVISNLKRMEYGSYFSAQKPALAEEHMKKRLRWAQEHVNWTDEQWSCVIWSDESWFTIANNDSGARVIRKVGERYDAKHTVQTKKYGGGGVMIWSCFHANGLGPLVLVDGTVDQDKYINISYLFPKDNLSVIVLKRAM
ncbi:hypothetical protein RMATCC62417_15888 [Rhizopus microsporus]|nr:hypothetical protein RMATCC62417_15888 [Rhizopus microsporus]